ncbi:MAG: NosD domain-containing protein [Planctomycetota bacterium]
MDGTSAGRAARALLLLLAAVAAEPSGAREYFVSNAPGSGSGTAADPFGMADLPDPTSEKLRSKAIEALQPGDTLTFRGGDYAIKTLKGKYYWLGYLRAARPGKPDHRITFRAQPGQTVRLVHAGGGQPMLGGGQHVTYQGFIIETGPHAAARIGGTGVEVAYCHIKGIHLDTSDNHDGLRIENARACHIHHNIIEGVTGRSPNSVGIKLYRTTKMVIEDNYIHSNTAGIFDKDSGIENTYRRNFLTRNRVQFYGNNQGKVARYFIHDNVVDGQLSLHAGCDGCEVHDNLVRADTLTGAWAGGLWNSHVWNNIVLSGGKPILAFYEKRNVLVTEGDSVHLVVMDFNLYDAAPRYEFGEYARRHQKLTLADMRARGFEKHSRVVAGASELFVDETSWRLKPQWAKAGKDGEAPGPDDIAAILDLTRYGPAAAAKPAVARDGEAGRDVK